MSETEIPNDEKLQRAIVLLQARAAVESQARPLHTLSQLARLGLVDRRAYVATHAGQDWQMYETTLNEAGRQVASAIASRGGPLYARWRRVARRLTTGAQE